LLAPATQFGYNHSLLVIEPGGFAPLSIAQIRVTGGRAAQSPGGYGYYQINPKSEKGENS
jgi:hypothetical protein